MIRNNEGAGDGKVMAIQEDPVVAVNMYRAAVLNTSSEEPLDLSPKKVAVVERAQNNSTRIIKIFKDQIARASSSRLSAAPDVAPKRRLKHHTMGEVLTSDDVLQRLEESKISKKRPKTPKPSTSKKQKE